ncbi:MAG TPA: SHOCT domain-containing protein [Acidimicrobiales bacterium]|jgi:putative membrane protein|nr:SHOCT domain-containing protein [Acidimicrobiales bacterium]
MNFFGRSGVAIHGPGPGGVIRFGPFGPGQFGPRGPLGAFVALVVFLIVIAAAAFLVTLIVRRSGVAHRFATGSGPHTHAAPATDALRILDERFARGEIDAADYRERRDLLQGTP